MRSFRLTSTRGPTPARVSATFFRPVIGGAYALAIPFLAAGTHAETAPRAAIRTGDHSNFGRLVFDVGAAAAYKLRRAGDTVTIEFADGVSLQQPPHRPRNVRSFEATGGKANFVLNAGATIREMRVDGHVVIDVLDPATPRKPPSETPAPTPPKAPDPPVAKPASDPPPPAPAPTTAPKPATEQTSVPAAAPTGPVALAAAPLAPPGNVAMTVPFAPQTGAGAFRRGSDEFVVFDERRPIDLSALRGNPVFGTAAVRELPSGTLLVLHPPPNAAVALTRVPAGWQIAILPSAPSPRAIPFTPRDGHKDLTAEAPGRVISMADPVTGATLLVGTVRRAGQAAQAVRRTPEFTMLPAELGVVVEPLADSVALRTVPSGFQLTGGPNSLAVTQPSQATEAAAVAAHLTRRFSLPAQSPDALRQSLSHGIAADAAMPAQARGPSRRALARTMLSLGMAPEAEALLRTAVEQDPKEAASPDTMGLVAIAALAAGRPGDAAGIDDPRLDGSDEIALWRAVKLAMEDESSPGAAATFAATAPLALLYPAGIRDRVLPLIVETMLLGGESAAAKRLLALAGDVPGLGYARALLRQADGDATGALAALDALANGHDRRDHARAATRAIELRLAAGQLDAAKAADALDRLRYAWRGDRHELAVRERIADLRQRAGAWRAARAELRAAQADFPDKAPAIQTHLMGTFMTLLYSDATDGLSPLDLVALVEENADLLKAMPSNEDLQARLADRLLALDLPARAAPLLETLTHTATTAESRATFGARLADLRLKEGDAKGALSALATSDGPGVEAALTEQRAVLTAGAKSRLGDAAGAIEALANLTGVRAETARASIYEQSGDWAAAEAALTLVVGTVIPPGIPPAGELNDDQRQLVLRLATAAQRSGDRNGLAALRATLGARLGSGPVADTIRLLTAEPVQGTADLPRAEQEMGLARSVPAAMAVFKAR